jgi:hypothetical protein
LARFGRPERVDRKRLNGERALGIVFAGRTLATIHLESRGGRVVSIRTILDPERLGALGL